MNRSGAEDAALEAEAARYAEQVLGMAPGRPNDDLVFAAANRAAHQILDGDSEAARRAHVHRAVRHEAWRRQRHPARVREAHRRRRQQASAVGANRVPRPVGADRVDRPVATALLALVLVAVLAGAWAAKVTIDRGREDRPDTGAPAPPARIQGRVVVDDGTKVTGRGQIGVHVTDDAGITVATEWTDQRGVFQFAGLAPADYDVVVDPPAGLAEAPSRTTGPPPGPMSVRSGSDISLTIVLEPS